MLIAESFIHLRAVDLPLRELAAIELEIAETAAREFLRRFDPSVEVRVEEASRKLWARFMTVATVLGFYGGIRSTVEYAVKDGQRAAGWVNEQVLHRLEVPDSNVVRQESRLGVPGELKMLFDSVQAGVMTADQATKRAMALLQAEAIDDKTRAVLALRLADELRTAGSQAPAVLSGPVPTAPKERDSQQVRDALPQHGVLATRDPKTGKVRFETY